MKSRLWLLAPIFALGQVRQIAILPLEPKALAVDSAGNIFMAGNTRYSVIDNSASLPALNRYRNRAIVVSAGARITSHFRAKCGGASPCGAGFSVCPKGADYQWGKDPLE